MSETDALKALNDLKASLSYEFWDWAAYVSLFSVFIGVFGETVVELTQLVRDEVLRQKLAKASALILIAGLGGDIVTHAKNSANTGIITDFLNREAGEAYKVGQLARVRANDLAVQVQVLEGKNDQFQRDNQIRQKEIDEKQASLTKQLQAAQSAVRGFEGRERPASIDEEDLRSETKGLRRNLRNVTIIRISDPVAGVYATNLGAALERLKPPFHVVFEDIPSSRFRGVIVCENGKPDRKVGQALKQARIVTGIKPITAEECTQSVPSNAPPGLFGAFASTFQERVGTVIFVGHRRLSAAN